MRIVIDLQSCQTESRFRGIGRYSMSLASAMARNSGDHELWFVVSEQFPDGVDRILETLGGDVPASRIRAFPSFQNVGWISCYDAWQRNASERIREGFLESLQPDFVHITSLFEGAQGGSVSSIGKIDGFQSASAVTLYDLIPLLNPDVYLASDWGKDWYFDKIVSLKRADLLLSISEHARQEALDALKLDPDRIVNMSSAISPMFSPREVTDRTRAELANRYGIRRPYIMYASAMEPRKNVDGLLKAFSLLRNSGVDGFDLVLTGKVSPEDRRRFDRTCSELSIAGSVRFTGFVEDDDLVDLYSAAALFVFPSVHEGFGLPALEAMACGIPTIGSNTTSVPEVIGREDAQFDPLNPSSIADLMRRVLTDEAFREDLKSHAPKHAAKFSWEKTAKRALAAMENVASKRPIIQRVWPASFEHVERTINQTIQAVSSVADASGPSKEELSLAAAKISRMWREADGIARSGALPARLTWRLEGPFDSSYSLALVNRQLGLALADRGHQVVLHSSEGPGDFDPSPVFLESNPEVAKLFDASKHTEAGEMDVTGRLMYPPRTSGLSSRLNILHAYAWEETGFPQDWVEAFNENLQGISCVSEHVRKILIDNGVEVPIEICGNGVDHWDNVDIDAAVPELGEGFKFLHVSSCFPRKGVDVMLSAFGRAFTAADQVTLVIKTFPNEHNEVSTWIDEAKKAFPNYPHVILIEKDVSDAELKRLYSECDALVAPSRAEGFGLPLAEAMLMGLPVITTAWGGQRDFCSDDTAWLVDYTFQKAESHLPVYSSVWAEPDEASLAETMRAVRSASPQTLEFKRSNAIRLLRSKYTWAETAQRLESHVRSFAQPSGSPLTQLGWITTWNTKCGIATYSENLSAGLTEPQWVFSCDTAEALRADEANVVRCWQIGQEDTLERLDREIERRRIDCLLIQFQYSFFHFPAFSAFLKKQKAAGRTVVVLMHATMDAIETPHKQLRQLVEGLRACDRVLVHSVHDLNRLKAVGVDANTTLFPHGVVSATPADTNGFGEGPFKIATYGFFLPHKGLVELIEAVEIMVARGIDVELSMINAEYPDPISRTLIESAKSEISRRGLHSRIRVVSQFLDDGVSMRELESNHVVVFPYQRTGESASGAVRYGLASGRVVAVTPLPIFDDLEDSVYRLPGLTPADIASGLIRLRELLGEDDGTLEAIRANAANWRSAHEYPRLARRLHSMSRQLVRLNNN